MNLKNNVDKLLEEVRKKNNEKALEESFKNQIVYGISGLKCDKEGNLTVLNLEEMLKLKEENE